MPANPSFKKRERERAQREKQQDKDRKRKERRDGKPERSAADGEDPDLAGIVAGPQAPLFDSLPLSDLEPSAGGNPDDDSNA
jgi:hypothetical protein